MILASSSSSCCFCWNAVSQPSVSPLCDLINECWATRPDPLWGGHIWTLYIEIHICLSLYLSFSLFFCLSLLSSPFFVRLFPHSTVDMHTLYHISHSPSSLLPLAFSDMISCPLMFFYFLSTISVLPSTFLTLSFHRRNEAPLSPSLPQEPLTSAVCGAKVVPLSVPRGSGYLCSECLNGEERRGNEEKERGETHLLRKLTRS